jgi:ribose-phosphate pyrophosphokinase
METNIKLYATSTAEKLGEQIAQQLGIPLNRVHKEKFSDGELFVRFNESVRGQVLFVLAKIHMPYENLFELMLTVDAARRSSAKEVILVIPYLPHSRQERRDNQRTQFHPALLPTWFN